MTNSPHNAKAAFISGTPPHLVVRDRTALGAEDWGPYATRPWVHLADAHAAMEKALWCYERGMVPLVTERDPASAAVLGQRYSANLLMTDPASLEALEPYLSACTTLTSVTVFGARTAQLDALLAGREVRYVESNLN